MYFFDLQGLINQHVEKGISSREQLNYFFAYAASAYVANLIPSAEKKFDLQTFFFVALFAMVILAGVYFILNSFFKKNGADQGSDFILRLFTVGWVLSCRLLIVLIPLSLFIYLTLHTMGPEVALISSITLLACLIGCFVYYFKMMRKSLQEIHQRKDLKLAKTASDF